MVIQLKDSAVVPAVVMADDTAAIAEVIRTETVAFQQSNFDAWADHFVHSDRTCECLVSSTAGLNVVRGWDAIASKMKAVFDTGIGCPVADFGQDNLQISISGPCAWVVYDGWNTASDGGRNESFETRVLEKEGGRWRIVYSSCALKFIDAPMARMVGVDADGQIVRAAPDVMASLADHPLLTVSAGRLRAHRRAWDKQLQAAITSAAAHHGYFETMDMAVKMGKPAEYPVILGKLDDGGVAVTQITIRDGVTYVRLEADEDMEQRMAFAKAAFGLSDAQVTVAQQIAMGNGPTRLAETLGISVNTVRTHLSRLYEKTGVSTQPALVRLLLSVG